MYTIFARKFLRSCCRISLTVLALIVVPYTVYGTEGTAEQRGEYLFKAASCAGCHTAVKPKGKFLAGGRPLETPFGAFFPPNITSDPEFGIGKWQFQDFVRAMRDGKGPDGTIYFPAFPYPSYTGMTDADLADLWAYLRTVPAVAEPAPGHDLDFPFNIRLLVWPWRWLYFEAGGAAIDQSRPAEWQRGSYLVRSVSHCGECHTPRNLLGGLDASRELGGNSAGPDGKGIPNISPHAQKGIGEWGVDDIESYLELGVLPDGDFAGGKMVEVIENSTGMMTAADRKAIAVFVKSVPSVDGP